MESRQKRAENHRQVTDLSVTDSEGSYHRTTCMLSHQAASKKNISKLTGQKKRPRSHLPERKENSGRGKKRARHRKRPLSTQVTPEGETTAEKHQRVEQVGYVRDDDGDVHPIFLSEKQAVKRKEVHPWKLAEADQEKFRGAWQK